METLHITGYLSDSHPCNPHQKFIFVKNVKAASSTVGSVCLRYGLTHHLTPVFAENPEAGHLRIINSRVITYNSTCSGANIGYDYIVSHIPSYDYHVLNDFIPDAKFFTTVRSPYSQFESAFYFYNWEAKFKLSDTKNPFHMFVENISEYSKIQLSNNRISNNQLKNGQMYMFGFASSYTENQNLIDEKIRELDKEFDLVMIAEYMDESLVLLKKMMCWEFDDIIYYSNKVMSRETRSQMTENVKTQIADWNSADLKLYEHFNRTLWLRIKQYEGDFDNDLQTFRIKQEYISKKCDKPTDRPTDRFCRFLKLDCPALKRRAFHKMFKFCSEPKNL
ncbi:galactose-3-O-sulfotransferase 2-like [Saccoglossus kowalevskii]|uniref:Galactose-3-O-sulfotransferase 2-like n=1 Tax=Saccoglossus kowalevskii TaxID=10224 RepID=A0ABM0MZW4_SACKO|nr:PREDICTED: galactose-3-O-sulfotransferase 2-like [Saccoglossus kowalevskii]